MPQLPDLKKNNDQLRLKRFKQPKTDIYDPYVAKKQLEEFIKEGENNAK